MVTVVVLNYNDHETTASFLKSIKDYSCIDHIVVVDNCSTDDSYAVLSKLESTKVDIVKSQKNGGYGYGNNYGMKYAHDKYGSETILISNPDVEFTEAVLRKMEDRIRQDEDTAVVAATMKDADGQVSPLSAWRIKNSGWDLIFGSFAPYTRFAKGYRYQDVDCQRKERVVDAVPGSMLLTKYSIMEQIGFYDEEMFLYWEETVLGIKLRNIGKKTVVLNDCFFLHQHSVSISKTFKTEQAHLNLMWNSLETVLKKYFYFNRFQMYAVSLLKYVNLLLCRIRA